MISFRRSEENSEYCKDVHNAWSDFSSGNAMFSLLKENKSLSLILTLMGVFVSLLSHCGRLHETALKGYRGKNRDSWCVYAYVPLNTFKHDRAGILLFLLPSALGLWFQFCEDWQNPKNIANPNIFLYFQHFGSKDFRLGKTTVGSVCVYEPLAFLLPPEPRIKILAS